MSTTASETASISDMADALIDTVQALAAARGALAKATRLLHIADAANTGHSPRTVEEYIDRALTVITRAQQATLIH